MGNQTNPLSKLCRSQLLIVANPYYNPERGVSKEYLLNLEGAQLLAYKIGRTLPTKHNLTQTRVDSAAQVYGKTIQQGSFEYTEKSHRLWNDLQRIESTVRKPLFEMYGYVHEYDIKTAAPSIIYQLASRYNQELDVCTIKQYLDDPNHYRNSLAESLDVDTKTAKTLITARFAGARFGATNSLMHHLDGNWIRYHRLKINAWYQQLSTELVDVWQSIKTTEDLPRLTPRTKWSVYFREELRVMRVVHRYLDKHNISYFHEHDGWRSTESVDLRGLKLQVRKQTGYWLDFV
jgi:hypothetical protein